MIELYHCPMARSFRCLWALEYIDAPYKLHVLAFPPKVTSPEFLSINPLGTVPAMLDGKVLLTESIAALQYLAGRYAPDLALRTADADYAAWLEWTVYGEASLAVPLGLIARYKIFEPEARRLPQAVEDAKNLFVARLEPLEKALHGHDYLAGGRLTIADMSVQYALDLADFLKMSDLLTPNIKSYAERLRGIPSYKAARKAQKPA